MLTAADAIGRRFGTIGGGPVRDILIALTAYLLALWFVSGRRR
jgi:hypothetical protein